MNIIIGFSTHKKQSLISRMIKLVERTPYSHTYSVIDAKSLDRRLVYHASENNIHFMGYPAFIDQNILIEEYSAEVTEEEKIATLQYCIDMAGRHYGRLEFVGIGLVRLVKWITGKQINNPWRDAERTMVCSEIIGHILIILGSDIDPKELEIQGPKFIRQKLLELAKKRSIVRIS